MCYAGNCHPECDNCKPKYLTCPTCASRIAIMAKRCPFCECPITEANREHAKAEWAKTHMGQKI